MQQDNKSSISASEEGDSEVGEVFIIEDGNGGEEEEEDMGLYLKDGEYNVEKLVDMKIEKGKKMILVKWQGYPHSQNTWEPIENLDSIPTMVADFEQEYAKKSQLKTLDKQAIKQARSRRPEIIPPKESKNLKRFATASLTNESITKKIKGNSESETREEAYDAGEESSPTGEQSPIVEIVEEEIVESKSLSSKSNQKKVSKPQLKTVSQKKVYSHKKKDSKGDFKWKDKPLCIKGVKAGKGSEFSFLVEWEKRNDGTKPENSHVSNEEFKTYAPKFLFEFYESKLVIFSRKKKPQKESEESPIHESEEAKENTENKEAFDNPVDSKKFSDKNNHQMLEEMSRELDAHFMDDNNDDDSIFPN